MPSAPDYARFGRHASGLDRFEVIDFHLDCGNPRSRRVSHISCQSSRGIRERGKHTAVNNAVDLLVPLAYSHSQDDAARLRFVERKSELLRRVAFAQPPAKLVNLRMRGHLE